MKRIIQCLLLGAWGLWSVLAAAAVDANTATAADLDSVKGIGPGTSGRIMEARKAGPFKDWSDFVDRVRGIGPGNAAKLSDNGLTVNGQAFKAMLDPDGEGSHWLKVDKTLREAAGVAAGDKVALVIAPVKEEPEPVVPPDVRKALAAAPAARAVWTSLTPVARRDWIHWITSGKKAETRTKRIATACDMLASGKRRACCFDRSGMYSKGNMGAPVAAE